MEIHGSRFQVIPRPGIPVCDYQTIRMAKGILAELRKALLREGIDEETVNNMLTTKGGRIYFGLDAMEELLIKVAERTRVLLRQGESRDYETLVKAIKCFSNTFTKPKTVKRLRTATDKRKDLLEDGLWVPLAKDTRHDKTGRCQTFIVFKKQEGNNNIVSDAHGLNLLAEAAEMATRKEEANIVQENPILARILRAPVSKSN